MESNPYDNYSSFTVVFARTTNRNTELLVAFSHSEMREAQKPLAVWFDELLCHVYKLCKYL
ncbi:hypothetical protein GCM10010913_47150 [Paenibacillus aceti]|uniref:Uncharacterized protein n=1 Tax=Paenibacillus aceti TaxID=1820010 RepID=A0ABQ1W9J7_9BACL|nr:hypothetical protein GCM10010913_47150 [Paenibacillus aceti]